MILRERIDKTSTVHFLGIDASASRAERKTGSIFLKNNGRNYYDQCHPLVIFCAVFLVNSKKPRPSVMRRRQ